MEPTGTVLLVVVSVIPVTGTLFGAAAVPLPIRWLTAAIAAVE